jgi:hypothetical protein
MNEWRIRSLLSLRPRLCPKSSPCRDLKSSLRPLRISVISALNNYRDYSYAEITEIRRDRREELVNCKNHFSGKAPLRPIVFGISVFNLVWTWTDAVERLSIYAAHGYDTPPFFVYERLILASFLLLASIGLLLRRLWSECASLVVSGFFLYALTIRNFWYLAHNAEVPLFSYRHVSLWYPNFYGGQLLHIVVSALIFCCAAASLRYSIRLLCLTNDPANPALGQKVRRSLDATTPMPVALFDLSLSGRAQRSCEPDAEL